MQRLLLLGLNHKTAPLEVREKLAFSPTRRGEALQAFRRRFDSCEAVLVSTCNRVELYVARALHGSPTVAEMVEFLAQFQSIPAESFRSHLYEKSERALVEHLFSVTASLDSMVLGETQILGQVRDAYDEARTSSAAGTLLNPLFQRALAVGKQVLNETPLNEGRLSVASVAVDFAKRIFDRFSDKTVLSIGAGKMSVLVLRAFSALQSGKLMVCNRDPSKAAVLASQFGGESAEFEKLSEHLALADIVVSGTGSREPIITRRMFDTVLRKRRYRPMFLIDIALPRDVEAEVGKIENVYLYNLDDLQEVVSKTQSQRSEAVGAARAIVMHHVEEFIVAHRTREMGPVIDKLYRQSHHLAQDEVARTLHKLPGLNDGEKAHLEELARRIVNKLLHNPVHALRHPDSSRGATTPYLHALEKLFALNDETPASGQNPSVLPTESTPVEDGK